LIFPGWAKAISHSSQNAPVLLHTGWSALRAAGIDRCSDDWVCCIHTALEPLVRPLRRLRRRPPCRHCCAQSRVVNFATQARCFCMLVKAQTHYSLQIAFQRRMKPYSVDQDTRVTMGSARSWFRYPDHFSNQYKQLPSSDDECWRMSLRPAPERSDNSPVSGRLPAGRRSGGSISSLTRRCANQTSEQSPGFELGLRHQPSPLPEGQQWTECCAFPCRANSW